MVDCLKVPLIHLPGVPEKSHERQTFNCAGQYSNLHRLYTPSGFFMQENNHHRHQRILIIMEFDYLLTRSGLTHPQASSVVFPCSFCLVQIDLNTRSGLFLTAIRHLSI
jgi:hypothetical protein